MSESDLVEGTDISASELMEKFDISEEQADKIVKALPDLCKEFTKAEGQPGPGQRQQFQYPYPAPYPYPVPGPQLRLSPDMTKELQAIAEAAAEELGSMEDFIPMEDICAELSEDELKVVMDLNLTELNEAIDAITDVIREDEGKEGEEEPDEEDQRRRVAARFQRRQPLARAAEIILRPLRAFFARRQQYPYPYPYPYPAPTRTQVGRFTGRQQLFARASEGDSKMPFMDALAMDMDSASIKIGEDGVLTADCVATAAMVQDYDGMKVLKCPDELKLAVDFARQIPICHKHPEDGIVTEQDQVKGWTSPVAYDAERERVACGVEIVDAELVKAIEDGKTDVSIGFFCDLDKTPGEFKGEKYDAVQRNIVLNHLAAGVEKGRCPGGTCGIGQDAVKDCENCPEKETCDKKDMKPPATDMIPKDDVPAVDKLGEDATVEMHEQLLKEQTDAIKAIAAKIAAGAGTLKVDELQALGSQLSDITYELRNTAKVVQTKNLGVDSQILTDATAEISAAWKVTTDILTKPLVDAMYSLEEAEGHTHTVDLNEKGDGTSSKDDGHSHRVIGNKVMFAEGHTHKLKKTGDEDEPAEDVPAEDQTKAEIEATMAHFKLSKEAWDKLSKEEQADLIKKYLAKKGDTDPEPEPEPKDKNKTDAEKALDLKRRETVDAIMDFNPPEPRETYDSMELDELERTLALIKSQSQDGSIPRSGSKTSDTRRRIDEAYAGVEKRKLGK